MPFSVQHPCRIPTRVTENLTVNLSSLSSSFYDSSSRKPWIPLSLQSHSLKVKKVKTLRTATDRPIHIQPRRRQTGNRTFVTENNIVNRTETGTWNKRQFVASIGATSAPVTPDETTEELKEVPEALACPICYEPLKRFGPKGLTRQAIVQSSFRCDRCRRSFSTQDGYLDLVVTTGVKEYREPRPPGIEIFRSPLVSFAYERGWRQSFARAGFPGPDEEFQMAEKFLAPARGGLLLDVSCGSGLFSRRFAASNKYSAVVALDFSENMLRQAGQYINEDTSLLQSNVVLVRADVARLPFATGSVDGVHAGAALHCWPQPSLAVSEISRILKPGGVFVATTFLAMKAPFGDEFVKPFRQAVTERAASSGMKYWEPEELEELCEVCGLSEYTKDQRREFIMLMAKKPN